LRKASPLNSHALVTVFDSSRFIPSYLYDKIHHEFPAVVFVDHIGGDGRLKAEFKPDAIPFSVPSRNAKGLDTTVVEASYLIDAAVIDDCGTRPGPVNCRTSERIKWGDEFSRSIVPWSVVLFRFALMATFSPALYPALPRA
jgi:hypothetical protein